MKVIYNRDGDSLHIVFRSAPISETENHRPGLTLDYDQHGRIVSLELAEASKHMSRPHTMDFIEYVGDAPGDSRGGI